MNPANLDRVTKVVFTSIVTAGGYVVKKYGPKLIKILFPKQDNEKQQIFINRYYLFMAKRNKNEEDLVIYDYPGWKRSPNESNEDYNDRLKDM